MEVLCCCSMEHRGGRRLCSQRRGRSSNRRRRQAGRDVLPITADGRYFSTPGVCEDAARLRDDGSRILTRVLLHAPRNSTEQKTDIYIVQSVTSRVGARDGSFSGSRRTSNGDPHAFSSYSVIRCLVNIPCRKRNAILPSWCRIAAPMTVPQERQMSGGTARESNIPGLLWSPASATGAMIRFK